MNTLNGHVRGLLDSFWKTKSPRGQNTRYKKYVEMRMDPRFTILWSKSRPFDVKYFCGELAWFLTGEQSVDGIVPYSSFWKRLADADGNVNSNYGSRLLQPQSDRSQLQRAYASLVADRDTRQAIAFVSGKEFQVDGTKDFPCTVYLNFSIDEDRLNMVVRMRSNDVFFGLTYDAPWFGLLQQNMFLLLKKVYPELVLGTYVHSADDLHYYERHFDTAANMGSYLDCEFSLKTPLFEFDEKTTRLTDPALRFMRRMRPDMQEADVLSALKEIVTFQPAALTS